MLCGLMSQILDKESWRNKFMLRDLYLNAKEVICVYSLNLENWFQGLGSLKYNQLLVFGYF